MKKMLPLALIACLLGCWALSHGLTGDQPPEKAPGDREDR